ncbi:hypothetical protein Tco_0435919 [Tanacetum coccineum]
MVYVINKRRHQRSIRGVLVNREWIDNPKRVKREFYDHFASRFSNSHSTRLLFEGSFPCSLRNEQASSLEAVVRMRVKPLRNFLHQIVGKILANRLSVVIDDLVSSEQSAFIKGRQILDGPMILNEVLSGVTNDEVTRVARLIGCEAAKTPFKFLGVVVGDHMSRSCAWDNVVDRVVSRLSNWKARTLSIGGRLTLIKWVIGSLPTYYFSLFKVPSLVLKKLESLRSCFLRGANDRDKKLAWVSWDKVLANKKNGGLSVNSFFAMNRALLFKWVWSFKIQKEVLCNNPHFHAIVRQ